MSPKPEPPYNSIQPGRTLYTPQTPYSAVSSFNLPAHYDLSLMTPVTMSESPAVPAKTSPSMNTEKQIKLSPTSPTSDNYTTLFAGEDDFGGRYSNPPMKHKDPASSYGAGTPDSGFPCSPLECPIPYFGAFAVSGGYTSTREHGASPVMHQSPNLMSAGGMSNDSRNSRQPTPGQQSTTSYRSHNQAPILIAPNPSALRKSSESSSIYHRQNSIHSTQASTPRSQGPPQGAFHDTIHPSTLTSSHSRAYSHSSGSRKRKSPESGFEQPHELLHLDSDLNYEESLLLQLSDKQELPWKEVVKRFNEKTGKTMKVPALQMRKKRLIERLRAYTGPEITTAWEEDRIAGAIRQRGCTERFRREREEARKWNQVYQHLYPQYITPSDTLSIKLHYTSGSSSTTTPESLAAISPASTVTMDEVHKISVTEFHSLIQDQREQARTDIGQRYRNIWGSSNGVQKP